MKPNHVSKLSFDNANFSVGDFARGHITKTAFVGTEKPSFKTVMMNTMGNVNNVVSKPDAMMTEAITTGAYDIHDVMLASAKAELAVTITSQFATKVVQAYDKILQIQI